LEWFGQTLAGAPVVIGSYHQKTLMMDGPNGPVAFCSGCDITHGSRRKDEWHDASIQIKGNCAIGIVENFVERWNAEADGQPKLPMPAYSCNIHKCTTPRTMPSDSKTEIRDAYVSAIAGASQSIYLENQYLRDVDIGRALVEALVRGVQVTIVLPTDPEEARGIRKKGDHAPAKHADPIGLLAGRIMVYSQYRILKALLTETPAAVTAHRDVLRTLKDTGSRKLKIWRPKQKDTPYVHAKLVIIDENLTLIGSANANGRSMQGYCDSEIDMRVPDAPFAAALRKKLDGSLQGRITSYDAKFIDQDEEDSRVTKDEMLALQNKLMYIGLAGALSVPAQLIEELTLYSALPGLKEALQTSDTLVFRDYLTDAVSKLI
jgi:phosphatidylserine/phosphatidylglycerophosphate/cardiolipin synthase-like enzyme